MELSIHPVMVRALVQCLGDVFARGFYADKVLERAFKQNKKWGSRDRRFLAETLYDMVRWWGSLVAFDGLPFVPESDAGFLSRWAVFELWKNSRDVFPFVQRNFPATKLAFENSAGALGRIRSAQLSPWESLSFPRWLYEKFVSDYGGAAESVLRSLNEPAPVMLRINTLKSDVDKTLEALRNEGIEARPVPTVSTGLQLQERKNVFATKAFKEGLFEVQDLASQKVALLLEPRAGERIADVCAGAGGKTLQLAALMQNKGTLFAGDVSERKLEQLKKRARRAGVSNLRVQLWEGSKSVKRHSGKFNGVLVDAPCSGSGVIRRNADTKWKLKPSDLERVVKLQEEILEAYSKLVAPGGRLVYATCSLFFEENEKQIESFLIRHPEFKTEGEALKTRPDVSGEDGFFAQKMVRNQ